MNTQELKQQAREEFKIFFMKENICRGCLRKECDYSTTGCPSYQDSILLNTEGGDVSTEERVNNFLDSLIDRTVQATEKRIVEIIENMKKTVWEYDTVCTHFQDNCSCKSDKEVNKYNHDVMIHNKTLKDLNTLITNNNGK